MAVAKMKLVNIVGRLKDFDKVVQSCCINGNFHPEQASTVLQSFEEFIPIDEMNPYVKQLRTMIDLGVHNNIKFSYRDFSSLNMSDAQSESYIAENKAVIDRMNEQVRKLTQEAARLEQCITWLNHIKTFPISLDDLFACKFIKVRFGRLPRESYQKLEVYDEDKLMFFFPFGEDSVSYWGFYVALRSDAAKVDEIFTSLYFERIWIIEEAHGTPAEAIVGIEKMLADKRKELSDAQNLLDDYWDGHHAEFLQVYSRLKYLHDSFELRRYAAKCGESFYIFGWVPKSEIESFASKFDNMEYVDCIVENEQEAGDIQPPIKLVNNTAIKPFESFVSMYGLPNYREIDPTPLLATTYSLFFGIMFGDLGQGFVVFLGALFMRLKKNNPLASIILRCSIFSMIFGALYNSIFGYEGVLPFTVLPVHNDANTNTILLVSILIGIIMILFCMCLNMVNAIRQRNTEKLLFSNNGLAGFVFYGSIIVGVVSLSIFSKNLFTPVYIALLIILPLILMFIGKPLAGLIDRRKDWMPASKGGFFVEKFFEMFEVLLAFFSNTISYIRIGAYVLCHIGMMAAVFSISELSGHGQNLIAVIIGNVFVIALEGLLVGIQDMRLEFYEIFSRFFQGDGHPYEPVNIKYGD